MKWFISLVGVLLLLVACTHEGSSETKQGKEETSGQAALESSLKVKPAKLSKREKNLVNQIGGDYQTFYTVDGDVEEGDVLVSSIVVFKEGEQPEERLASVSRAGEQANFNKDLHSFQLQMEEETTYLTIGSPNGYARGTTTVPDNLGSFLFEQPEEEITITKGDPIYLSYLIGSSQNNLSIGANADLTTLPKSVEDAEYAIVFKLELKEDTEL